MQSPSSTYIRTTKLEDMEAIKTLAVATGLFGEEDSVAIEEMLSAFFEGNTDDHHWLTYDNGSPVGVAYYAPEMLTDGTWNLLMIAVHPDNHGQGIGSALMTHVEAILTQQGARILLVDTSGVESFERTRSFYSMLGYDLEARIRDYYADGDDKVTFRKSLQK